MGSGKGTKGNRNDYLWQK